MLTCMGRFHLVLLLLMMLWGQGAQAANVWVIDDGEKVGRDQIALPFRTGEGNPIWSPGSPVRLFALRNETLGLQVIVQADDQPLQSVTVELKALKGPGQASLENQAGAVDPGTFVGRWIERFVEHYFEIVRPSGTDRDPLESLGWDAGSGPQSDRWTGWMPDALIPVEIAPSWAPYPLEVPVGQNRAIWIDITIPVDQPSGAYQGQIEVREQGNELATLAVELRIGSAVLPDVPIPTMVFVEDYLTAKMGESDAGKARKHLMQLMHRHRVSPMQTAYSTESAEEALPALRGDLYTREQGYEGPGLEVGDGNLVLGPYGGLAEPAGQKEKISQIANLLAENDVYSKTDVFVYAIDEACNHPWTRAWKSSLKSWSASNKNISRIKVGVTCSENPQNEAADVVMVAAQAFDPALRAAGKRFWIYNGRQPYTGAFLTDTEAISVRVNGWIAGMVEVGRWFYWHATYWQDGNDGGYGPFDPFVTAETFHNPYNEWAVGDGLLLYPGKQNDGFSEHSLGFAGVISSLRLKNWRRGIQDAGYLQLARKKDPDGARAVAERLIPDALTAAGPLSGSPPSFALSGKDFFEARKELFEKYVQELTEEESRMDPAPLPSTPDVEEPPAHFSGGFFGSGCAQAPGLALGNASVGTDCAGLLLFILATLIRRKRRS